MKPHYVYRILGERGETVYVGKGSGYRLTKQKWAFKAKGEIVKRFATEKAAYDYEAKLIEQLCPPLNVLRGGGGALTKGPPLSKDEREMRRLGTRTFAARFLLSRAGIDKYITDEGIADMLSVAFVQRHARIGNWKEVTA